MAENKKLNNLLKSLEEKYVAHKAQEFKTEEKIRTGVFGLDVVLTGGISLCKGGHKIEFFGGESSGKSTFALKIVSQYQKLDKTCVYIDGENSYDPTWAEILGVENDKLIVVRPSSLEEMGDILVKLLQEEVDLIVIDSIVSLIPEEEIDRDTNEPTMALGARINALISRKINKFISDKKTSIIFINQLREKVGQMYGNPHTTGGGRALKHLYDTRVEFRLGKPIEEGTGDNKERIGYEINMKAVKNRKGVPYKTAIIDFYFNSQIDNSKSLFFAGIKYNVINFSGKTYEWNDKKAVGKEKFIEQMTDKDWIKLETEIWKVMK